MILDFSTLEIYLKPGHTDMRKQINSLAVIVQEEMHLDVFTKSLFLFCSRNRKLMKILYWDRNGFCMWMKRLEKDKFPWPAHADEVIVLDSEKLKLLLSGIDFFSAHEELQYSSTI